MQLNLNTNAQNTLFVAQVEDAINQCVNKQKPSFLGFLNEHEYEVSKKIVLSSNIKNYTYFGGYKNAERKFLAIYPEYYSVSELKKLFPIDALSITYRKCDTLNHKDFLGSIIALGLERNAIGDILIEEGRSVVFLKKDLAEFVRLNLNKVGNTGVNITYSDFKNLPPGKKLIEKRVIVSSLRLDNLVAAITGLSRSKTSNLIASGLVLVNTFIQTNNSYMLTINDYVTIRKKGKFVIDRLDGKTRKERLKIILKHYK